MLELQVLGPIAVRVDGVSTVVGSRTHRALIAGLASGRGRAVPLDDLAALVWDERPPASAAASLKSHVSRLRRVLGEDAITAQPPGYALTIDPRQLDLHRFERDVRAATTVRELDVVLTLWRGRPYGEFADHVRLGPDVARLCELHTQARVRRAQLVLAGGRPDDAVAEFTALAVDDPLREAAWTGLMAALHAAGRQADATRAARRCRRELALVGLEPSPAFLAAEREVYRHVPAPERQPASPVPVRLATVVGRQGEVHRLADALRTHRLVTLVGPGGVGKTTLAFEVARAVPDVFPDGRSVATLADIEHQEDVVAAVTRAVGAPATQPLEQSLADYLRPRQALVVLDNAEHVHAAVRRLAVSLLSAADDLRLLTTSRQPLGVPGELVVPVAPLSLHDAMTLFAQRARDVGIATDGQQELVAAVCTLLDRVPLLVEMAAARLRGLTLIDLVAELHQRLHLLKSTDPGRHATLDSVVGWSYDLLDEPQRSAFEQLSVFAGPFDLAAAEGVCATDGVAAALADLVDRSLVAPEARRPGAYRLLHVVRSFAAERLAASPAHTAVVQRFEHHCVQRAEAIAAGLKGPDEPTWARRFDEDTSNLEAAHARALENGDVDAAVRISAATYPLVYQRLRADVGAWAERTIATVGRADHPLSVAVAAAAAMNLLNRDDADGVLRLLADLPESPESRHAHEVLGELCVYRGDLDAALHHLYAAERLARDADDRFTAMYSRVSQAITLAYLSRVQEGLELVGVVRREAAAGGNALVCAWCDYAQGELLAESRPRDALGFLDSAVAAADAAGWRMVAGVGRLTASSLRARAAEPADAVPGFIRLIRHWTRLGDATHQWTTLRNLVELLVRIEALEPAAELLGALDQASIPTYGREQERLQAAAESVSTRLGERADVLVAAGRGHDLAGAVRLSLSTLTGRGREGSWRGRG